MGHTLTARWFRVMVPIPYRAWTNDGDFIFSLLPGMVGEAYATCVLGRQTVADALADGRLHDTGRRYQSQPSSLRYTAGRWPDVPREEWDRTYRAQERFFT